MQFQNAGLLPDWELLGNSLTRWVVAAGILAAVIIIVPIANARIPVVLGPLARRTGFKGDQLAQALGRKVHVLVVLVIGVFLGAQALELSSQARTALERVTALAFFVQMAIFAFEALNFWLQEGLTSKPSEVAASPTARVVIGIFGKIAIAVFAILLVLDNFGFNVTALITGLGIGGVAIALATQKVFSDVLASLAIILGKPFVVGDLVSIAEFEGTVEELGLRTTRLRSSTGEQVIFSNADLIGSRIRNFKRMSERRLTLNVAVKRETPEDKVRQVPDLLRTVVSARENVRFESAHLVKFTSSTLDFEAIYWVLSPEPALSKSIQQEVNFDVLRVFQEQGIELA